MAKIYTLVSLILLVNAAFSQMAIEWQKSYGGASGEIAFSAIETPDGGFAIVGFTYSNNGDVSGNHGDDDVWVVKVDNEGSLLWQKTLGGSGQDIGTSILNTPDNGLIILASTLSNDGDITNNHGSQDIWIIKLDSVGNIDWQKTYGGSSSEYGGNFIDVTDGIVIVGTTMSNDGDVSGHSGFSTDIWLFKIDYLGNLIWQKCVYSPKAHRGNNLRKTSDGGFYISSDSYDFDPICFDDVDARIVKVDSIGNFDFDYCRGGIGGDVTFNIIPNITNGITYSNVIGNGGGNITNFYGWQDVWLVNQDSLGNIVWQKTFGGSARDVSINLLKTNDNKFLFAGTTESINGDITNYIGAGDAWLVKVDEFGSLVYSLCFGGTKYDEAWNSITTSDGKLLFVGSSSSDNIDVSQNKGLWDFWIVKLSEHYNSISGKVFADLNSNFIRDSSENYISNHSIIELNSGRSGFSNLNGDYNVLVLDSGNFIASTPPIPYYWPAPITHSAYFSGINQIDSLNDFAFQPLGIVNDLKINISPITPFRPGFNASYNLHYKNIGTTSLTGTVVFYPDANVSFVSSDITPTLITGDSVLWSTPVLNPYDDGNILVTVNVNQNTSIGSMVNSGVKIEPIAGDTNPSNNIAYWEVLVTGAIDPNDILVNKETITTTELANSTYLEYLVRFQNTGNDTAFTVKVMNNITQMLDVSTFEFVNSSHPLEINYGNHSRLFEFKFENILLPDSNTNELLSHGFVRYRIKPFDTLSVGDLIENTAAIYFDFNAPVITNTAVTEVVLPTFVPAIKEEFNFSLYPNPTTGELNISFTLKETSHVKIELFNSLGQIVNTIEDKKLNSGENRINFSTENIPEGIYHLKFSVNGNTIAKMVVKM